MTQYYMGIKQVIAWEAETEGKTGYAVKYSDGYTSWSPKDTFESAYLPMGRAGNGSRVTDEIIDNFIKSIDIQTIGEKTTLVRVTLVNGFELVESSSCVVAANYSEKLGTEECLKKLREKIWLLLGFTLQWAVSGIKH